jgi:oligopeptide/dipeptide ABC transporter ATP-binding protein
MIIITHDVSVVMENCGRVAIMYAGKFVEYGNTKKIFAQPYHPYAIGLKNAFPEIRGATKDLISIPGDLPSLIHPPKGCRFFDRCPFGEEVCRKESPPLIQVGPDHFSACYFPERSDEFRVLGKSAEIWDRQDMRRNDGQGR